MPIYEYECRKCGHQTEAWQKFSDPPLTKCELCNGKLKKFISQSSFHLKGSGWYVTDYASKSRGKEEKDSKSEKDTSTASKGSTGSSKQESSKSGDSKESSKKT